MVNSMSFGFFLLLWLLLFIVAAISVHGQLLIGYISIDCGSPENNIFQDDATGITYVSDGAYIDTGISKNISSEYAYPNNPNLPLPLSDVRSFPVGNKNCYTLVPRSGNGSLYLIRALFLYGNYDGLNKLPEFDLYLDANLWTTVKFSNASDIVSTEIISVAESNSIHVCFLNKGLGTPFISGLELRPVNDSIYGTEHGTSASLLLYERLDIGSTNGSGRYKDDIYDRIWSQYISPSWNPVSTSLAVNVNEDGYRAPFEVIRTAARPQNDSKPLELVWTSNDPNSQFYVYLYFAEVEQLQRNQTRKFNISWNGSPLFGPFIPRYLYAATISNSRALVGKEHHISIYRTGDSTLPPILNAVEVYMVKQLDQQPTYGVDVDAIMNVKTTYQVNKTWPGDPCLPKNYSWDGLRCNYNGSLPPRIASLNLSSSGLSGTVVASIANLSSLESLDLSNNSLIGPVPVFLEELKSLKFLNLEGNQLSGQVPTTLLEKSRAGTLTMSVDAQNLGGSGSSKKKNKVIAAVVTPIASILALLIVFLILRKFRRKGISETDISKQEGKFLASKKRRFTYPEVLSITNNFQNVIGKGGFGTVYHGQVEDGTQVAVKILSPSSSQGPREFQTEAELLMTVHHRNLASFVGYCDDVKTMALFYEYMANGNLKDYLSDGSSHSLNWETRLRIAIDAAQGLEYLHHGCKPPIIHRDVKTANILLSENLDAKIADFGMSKAFTGDDNSHIMTKVMGTTGYLDPEYYHSQKLNEKSDVYSFGIVLLELITGQPAVIKTDERIHIVHWVSPALKSGDITSVVDQRLKGDFDINSIWKAFELAMACTTPHSIHRASMSFVLTELKQSLTMELSRDKGRSSTPGPREEMYIRYSSPEVCSSYSMDTDSMSGPFAR